MLQTITYNEKSTYDVIIHWNLLYALKTWNFLNFIQKRRLFFCLLKLLKEGTPEKDALKERIEAALYTLY